MIGLFVKTVNEWLFPQKTSTIDILYGSKYRSSCPKVFCKKVFLQISENSQENSYVRVY